MHTRRTYGPTQLPIGSDWLRAGRSGDRIPVGGEIFRTRPDQPPLQWVPGLSRG
jgi:hypothetical protein